MNLDTMRARYPSLRYVAPFLVFVAVLAIQPYIPAVRALSVFWLAILTVTLWLFSRDVIDFRARRLWVSAGIGVMVFLIWILPDELFPHYREHWLFQNSLTGSLRSSLPDDSKSDPFILTLRSLRAVFFVPVIEELFWRAWLMRWLVSQKFETVALGTYSTEAFLVTALLFATEHGPFWDVGLVAGVIYNWWMIRTRSLGDCILAHAVTNACLCGYVLATHRWEFWM